MHGERQEGGQVEVGRHRLQPGVARHAVGELVQVDGENAEPECRAGPRRAASSVEIRPVPVEESPRGLVIDAAQGLVDPRHAAGPVVDQFLPGLVVGLLGGFLDLAVGLVELLLVLGVLLLDRVDERGVLLLGLLEIVVATLADLLGLGRVLLVGGLALLLAALLGLGDDAGHLLLGLTDAIGPLLLELLQLRLVLVLDPILVLLDELLGVGERLAERDGMALDAEPGLRSQAEIGPHPGADRRDAPGDAGPDRADRGHADEGAAGHAAAEQQERPDEVLGLQELGELEGVQGVELFLDEDQVGPESRERVVARRLIGRLGLRSLRVGRRPRPRLRRDRAPAAGRAARSAATAAMIVSSSSGVACDSRPHRFSRNFASSWRTCSSSIATDQLASVARRHLVPSSRVPSKTVSACQPVSSLAFLALRCSFLYWSSICCLVWAYSDFARLRIALIRLEDRLLRAAQTRPPWLAGRS